MASDVEESDVEEDSEDEADEESVYDEGQLMSDGVAGSGKKSPEASYFTLKSEDVASERAQQART